MFRKILVGVAGSVVAVVLWGWVVASRETALQAARATTRSDQKSDPGVRMASATRVESPESPSLMRLGAALVARTGEQDASAASRPPRADGADEPASRVPESAPVAAPSAAAPAAVSEPAPAAAAPEAAPAAEPAGAPPAMDAHVGTAVNKTLSEQERLAAVMTLRDLPNEVRQPVEMHALCAVVKDRAESDTLRHEVACFLVNRGYEGMDSVLSAILSDPHEGARFRSFCIQHLWTLCERMGPEDRASILAELRIRLTDRDVPVRREALLALVRLNDPAGRETVMEWLRAPDAEPLRDLAVRCTRILRLDEAIPDVRRQLAGTNTLARIAAIAALGEWQDAESRAAIQAAANDDDMRVRRAVEAAVAAFSASNAATP